MNEKFRKTTARTAAIILSAALIIPLFLSLGSLRAGAAEISIGSAAELAEFAKNCVSDTYSKSLTVRLTADIDLSGSGFRPIPLFAGKFDGGGHTITGIEIDGAASYGGFFRQLLPGSEVSSLNLRGSVKGLDGAELIGGVAGVNRGVITGCSFEGSVSGGRATGGVCGMNAAEGIVEECNFSGSVSGGRATGGICGENAGTIRGSENSGRVTARPEEATLGNILESVGIDDLLGGACDAGGIAGTSSGAIRECNNSGDVGTEGTGDNAGGVCGTSSGYIENCENSGKISGRKRVGGIVGRLCPDFRMTFEAGKTAELKKSVAAINSAVNTLILTIALKGIVVSSEIKGLTSSVSDVEEAVADIIKDLEDFANGNIEAVNAISERINRAVKDVSPVLTAMSGSISEVSKSISALSEVMREAAALSELTDSAFDSVTEAADAALRTSSALAAETAAVAESAYSFVSDPGSVSVEEIKTKLESLLASAKDALGTVYDSVNTIYEALYSLRDAGEHVTAALALAAEASDRLSEAIESVSKATKLAAKLADDVSALGAVKFTLLNDNPASREKLLTSLEKINGHVAAIVSDVAEAGLSEYLTVISNEVKNTADIIADTFDSITHPSLPEINDVSVTAKSDSRRAGTITGCLNTGKISAAGSAGGIAGSVSIPLEYDGSLEIDFFALFTGGADVTVYSVIENCRSDAEISSSGSYAGGVSGDSSHGYITGCAARGKIKAAVSHAGGIAGRSRGSIKDCRSNVTLDCPLLCGGIAGEANSISGSMALTFFASDTDYAGAIAGRADSASGNAYAECDAGAVNGFTFAKEAEILTYNELLVRSGADEIFLGIRVTFDFGDGRTETVSISRGGTVEELPAREGDDGWTWNLEAGKKFYRDATVTGGYSRPGTAVPDGPDSRNPDYLAQGSFKDGALLTVSAAEAPAGLLRVQTAATASVDGYEGTLQMHVRADGRYDVYLFGEGSDAVKTESERDGSYIVFDMQSGGSFALVKNNSRTIIIAVAAGALLLAAGITTIIIVARKRKSKKTAN